MQRRFLEDFCCPSCQSPLSLSIEAHEGDEILKGVMSCPSCQSRHPILNGIPRFVPLDNYTQSFGFQWNRFSKTQLDSNNGTTISKDRFWSQTHWPKTMKGLKILELGCGMGRFSEIALTSGADLYSIDYSTAVEAARNNIGANHHHCLAQGTVYELPFPPNYFDKIFCFGVLQHTPNPEQSFRALVSRLKPGGEIAIDLYASPYSRLHPRHIFRPFTKRMKQDRLLRLVERVVPWLLPLSNAVAAIPKLGRILRHAVPVANYKGRYDLTNEQIKEWAILDTFDWLSPQYDQPQTRATVHRWIREAGLEHAQVERNVGLYIARAKKP